MFDLDSVQLVVIMISALGTFIATSLQAWFKSRERIESRRCARYEDIGPAGFDLLEKTYRRADSMFDRILDFDEYLKDIAESSGLSDQEKTAERLRAIDELKTLTRTGCLRKRDDSGGNQHIRDDRTRSPGPRVPSRKEMVENLDAPAAIKRFSIPRDAPRSPNPSAAAQNPDHLPRRPIARIGGSGKPAGRGSARSLSKRDASARRAKPPRRFSAAYWRNRPPPFILVSFSDAGFISAQGAPSALNDLGESGGSKDKTQRLSERHEFRQPPDSRGGGAVSSG